MTETTYPNTCTVYRNDYPTRKEYLEAYRDCCQHYGYKRRVGGGWIFFTYATDLKTWEAQK